MEEAYVAEIVQQTVKLAGCGQAEAEMMARAACVQIGSRLKNGAAQPTPLPALKSCAGRRSAFWRRI